MLVLSRKHGEKIHFVMKTKDGVEQDVELQVIGIGKKKVRLGINTSPEVAIIRHELTEARSAEALAQVAH